MGGMAVGSFICSRWSPGWRKLLIAYAATEAAIGALGLIFAPRVATFPPRQPTLSRVVSPDAVLERGYLPGSTLGSDPGCPCRTGLSRPAAVIIEWGGGFQMAASGQVILVVDDHNDTAELIAEMLRMEGFTSFATASVLEAVNLYERIRPALVITDEYLAGSTKGSDLLRVLRRKYGDAVGRALIITGLPDEVSVLSTDVVLEKPLDLDRLVAVVRALLGGPPAARQAQG